VLGTFAARPEREYQRAFTSWMQQHKKAYHHEQFQTKYATFKANMDFIDAHNADTTKTFKVGLNKFADMTNAEFSRVYLGTRVTVEPKEVEVVARDVNAPDSIDWRTKGAVTGVKNQGQCGSCWSFSTTGSTEGCNFLAGRPLVGLSEQNLMDCSTSQGNQGCDGGLMTQAMDYIISNGGLDTEASYPYTAEDGTSCQYKASNSGGTLKSYTNVQQGDETDLMNKVAQGPTSVAIDASHNSFQFYTSGIYYESACSSTQLDHGVLAAGYGSTSGGDFWLVKNSWGTDWGMQGYIQMSRNKQNNCGIATMATLPSC
jgi:cathepsin L